MGASLLLIRLDPPTCRALAHPLGCVVRGV